VERILIDSAINDWRSIVGTDNVVTEKDELRAAGTTTFATEQEIACIVRPASRADVQKCVRIANEHAISVYPISRGRNYGMGSRVPVHPFSALLDLSRMNGILEFDEALAYMVVQPGVTFRQAFEYLVERKSELCVSVTGGPPDGSLIGNTLERGLGGGPYGERLDHACGMEVVLPDGSCIHTGFGRFAGSQITSLSRAGVGPQIDGLFTQSNLGIVTAMTMWLMPRPRNFQLCLARLDDHGRLGSVTDVARQLMLRGVVGSNCFLMANTYKCAAAMYQFPWWLTGWKTPLSFDSLNLGEPWYVAVALFAESEELAAAQRRLVAERLGPVVDQLQFESDPAAGGIFLGVPTDANVRSTYWRKTGPPPANMDPDRDRCGVLWLTPVVPLRGDCVQEAAGLIQGVVKSHGFEPNLALMCRSGRAVHFILGLIYDRDVPGEDARAKACYDDLLKQVVQQGWFPYRLAIHSMQSLPNAHDDYGRFLRCLKRALDPNDILAPGRYDFRSDWPADE
jgi:FAD/FMN-containing dehydrogenase